MTLFLDNPDNGGSKFLRIICSCAPVDRSYIPKNLDLLKNCCENLKAWHRVRGHTSSETLSSEVLQVNMWHHCKIQFWILQAVIILPDSNYDKQQNKWYFNWPSFNWPNHWSLTLARSHTLYFIFQTLGYNQPLVLSDILRCIFFPSLGLLIPVGCYSLGQISGNYSWFQEKSVIRHHLMWNFGSMKVHDVFTW